ncbi:IS1 family transposase [Chryseobacterium sp. JV558]|uniref:IS1 family transposase n=1 Tax=Chryseobacterium sp. JV558 TaxID=2663236 RepID=UPI00299DCE71|nr:IS1 family transposase [Chryseobacterium sp. JV558]MDW9382514.1 hypothetical protein [Chryseobacterium sp. JV558]
MNDFCCDYWKSHLDTIAQKKHCKSKKKTVMVEGYDSRIRSYLARFKRKTKCYSKKQFMLENSLRLLFFKLNNQLDILN